MGQMVANVDSLPASPLAGLSKRSLTAYLWYRPNKKKKKTAGVYPTYDLTIVSSPQPLKLT